MKKKQISKQPPYYKALRQVLKQNFDLSWRFRTNKQTTEQMNKELFIQVIKSLKEIDDRTEFLESEIGMGVTQYEDKFFNVIENLMKMVFNKHQLHLVRLYIYEINPKDPDWDGMVTVEVGTRQTEVPFKTPADLWEAIKIVK